MVYFRDRSTVDLFSVAYFDPGRAQLVIVALWKLSVVDARFTRGYSLNQLRRLETHNPACTSPAGPCGGIRANFLGFYKISYDFFPGKSGLFFWGGGV